nr:unnamed protein product [Spirometra erinaceieuropaei]
MAEPAAAVRRNDASSKVAAHSTRSGNTFKFDEAEILARGDNRVSRKLLESWLTGPQSINKYSDLPTPYSVLKLRLGGVTSHAGSAEVNTFPDNGVGASDGRAIITPTSNARDEIAAIFDSNVGHQAMITPSATIPDEGTLNSRSKQPKSKQQQQYSLSSSSCLFFLFLWLYISFVTFSTSFPPPHSPPPDRQDNPRSNRPERRTALVAREMARYKVDIAALSEIRLSEQGELEVGAGYTFFWSGRPRAEQRDAGVASAIRNDIARRLTSLSQGINDRLMSLRLPLRRGGGQIRHHHQRLRSADEQPRRRQRQILRGPACPLGDCVEGGQVDCP